MSQCKKPFGPVTYHCIEDEGHTGDHKYEWTMKVLPPDIQRLAAELEEAVGLLKSARGTEDSVDWYAIQAFITKHDKDSDANR